MEIGAAHEAAERVASDLKKALQRAWDALSDPANGQGKGRAASTDGPWLAPALARYWTTAEATFWHMTSHPDEFSFPGNRFIRIALAAYEQATDHYAERGPRAARAVERARGGISPRGPATNHSPRRSPMPKHGPVPKEADKLTREVMRLIKHSPGDRSVLRHSLGKAPEEVAVSVHRIVVPLLPKDTSSEPSGPTTR